MIETMGHAELVAQLEDGFILLVLGMVTVFVFLCILIFATNAMSSILKKYAKPAPQPAPKKSVASNASSSNSDAMVAAAIAAAYDKSRN